ncbi:MAG: hypothetical protein CLLPBCKN_008456 [Chroococcidiopsis cubana SAG 39.79]|nr:hypothetical protein [Chroococcidiopsis cubana SAG 39.79]
MIGTSLVIHFGCQGELVVVPSTGGTPGRKNSKLTAQLKN